MLKSIPPQFRHLSKNRSDLYLTDGCTIHFVSAIDQFNTTFYGYTPDRSLCKKDIVATAWVFADCCDTDQIWCLAVGASGVVVEGRDEKVRAELSQQFRFGNKDARLDALQRMYKSLVVPIEDLPEISRIAVAPQTRGLLAWLRRLKEDIFEGSSDYFRDKEKYLSIGVVAAHGSATPSLMENAKKICSQGYFDCERLSRTNKIKR